MALVSFKNNELLWMMVTVLVLVTGSRAKPASVELNRATMCLIQLGFLNPALRNCVGHIDKDSWNRAITGFQSLAGLNNTGELDEETISAMSLFKCEVKGQDYFEKRRTKRYSFYGGIWAVKNLTYTISKYSSKLTPAEVNRALAEAFLVWENYTDFTFTKEESDTDNPVDIYISFVEGEHGYNDRFDGPGNVLAHSSFYYGTIHFNDAEPWTLDSHGINLLQVAVHEIGHILGLSHSKVESAAMNGQINFNPHFHLDQDDIDGIQELYPIETVEDDTTTDQPNNPSTDSTIHLSTEWAEY